MWLWSMMCWTYWSSDSVVFEWVLSVRCDCVWSECPTLFIFRLFLVVYSLLVTLVFTPCLVTVYCDVCVLCTPKYPLYLSPCSPSPSPWRWSHGNYGCEWTISCPQWSLWNMNGYDIMSGSCSNMDTWPQSAVESLCVCSCGCGIMECECPFIGKCMCMLLSFMKDRMPKTRDSNHELSLLVSSSTWHGLTIIGQQRTCTLRTL